MGSHTKKGFMALFDDCEANCGAPVWLPTQDKICVICIIRRKKCGNVCHRCAEINACVSGECDTSSTST